MSEKRRDIGVVEPTKPNSVRFERRETIAKFEHGLGHHGRHKVSSRFNKHPAHDGPCGNVVGRGSTGRSSSLVNFEKAIGRACSSPRASRSRFMVKKLEHFLLFRGFGVACGAKEVGVAERVRRRPCRPPRRMRNASACAASTNVVSLRLVRADSGVFERARRAQATSAFGASKLVSTGSGIERLRTTYSARR